MDAEFYAIALKEINDLLFVCPFSILNSNGIFENIPELSTGDNGRLYYYDSRDDDVWPIEHRLRQIHGKDVNWIHHLYFTDGWGEKYLLRDFLHVKYFIKHVYTNKECAPFSMEEDGDAPTIVTP